MRVLIFVIHLRGAGHLSRMLALAKALHKSGASPCIISGGMPVPALDNALIRLEQLPPIQADGLNYKRFLTDHNSLADDVYFANRQEKILQILTDFQPDILLTELFPFGRRALSAEFEFILKAAKAQNTKIKCFSSIRDILEPPSKPRKIQETESRIQRWYDGVFVHSDPELIPLQASWPVSNILAPKLSYTGFIGKEPLKRFQSPPNIMPEILINAGSGPTGEPLFRTALTCAQQESYDHHWRFRIANIALRKKMQTETQKKYITIEGIQPDFIARLAQAKLFIGQCGYNTAIEVLQTQTPAIWVPFEGNGEIEQRLRSEKFANHFGHETLPPNRLTSQNLYESITRILNVSAYSLKSVQLAGAAETTKQLWQHFKQK